VERDLKGGLGSASKSNEPPLGGEGKEAGGEGRPVELAVLEALRLPIQPVLSSAELSIPRRKKRKPRSSSERVHLSFRSILASDIERNPERVVVVVVGMAT